MSIRPTISEAASGQGRLARDPSLVLIRDLIYTVSGIFQPDNKLHFLQGRCQRRVRAVGAQSVRDYWGLLTSGPGRDSELRNLLNEITVGETCFFRNEPQLNAIRAIVLPNVMASRLKPMSQRLKVWSCGCSTGEEPYTLSMILLEVSSSVLKGWEWEIVATDLNDHSLESAKEGVYDSYSLRNVTPEITQRYFTKRGEDFVVSSRVKERVRFSRLNLLDEDKMALMKNNDLILCGNVLIYFDDASKRRTVRHFYNNLTPGGYFFLGHSESLYGVSDDFRLVHFPGATAYLKSAPAPAAGGGK